AGQRRQVGDPPEPGRAGQPHLHPVAGRRGTREADSRGGDRSGSLRGRARRRGLAKTRRIAPQTRRAARLAAFRRFTAGAVRTARYQTWRSAATVTATNPRILRTMLATSPQRVLRRP